LARCRAEIIQKTAKKHRLRRQNLQALLSIPHVGKNAALPLKNKPNLPPKPKNCSTQEHTCKHTNANGAGDGI